jgi:RimJ/RimL family protein N-acetyltransferase
LAGAAVYLLGFKLYVADVAFERLVELKPLQPIEIEAIRAWPPYEGKLKALDYALRAGGWLDKFPKSDANHRFGVWQNGKLVGFSLLVGINDREGEFYVALHKDHIGKRLGREVTRQTLRKGFTELGLEKIFLKVREGHPAQALYRSEGFRDVGPLEEPIQDQVVKFRKMETTRRQGWLRAA